VHTGKVARMQPFGAFIELVPGVDGLLHVSELGEGKRLEHPNEVLKDGQTVNVRVERVEKGAKRISLSVVPEGVTEADLKKAIIPRVGNIVKAKVVEHENNGLMWAQIEGSIGKAGKGLIPPNESNQPRGTDLRKAYPLGTEITVKVVEMERGRPKLSIKAALKDEERQAYRAYQREAASKPVGTSLADKLRAKLGNIGGGGSGR
jgi:small subunit ribosomal protein S1